MIYATNISKPDSRMRVFSRVRDFTAVVVLVHVVTFFVFSVLFWSFYGCKACKDNSKGNFERDFPVKISAQGPEGPFSRAHDMCAHVWAQAHYLTITVPIDTIS